MVKLENNRNYGIDILRSVAMLMVVLLHVVGQGGILDASVGISGKNEVLWLIQTLAYCAVNCYALISGYVNSKPKYASLALLWLQVAFYSISITALFAIFRPEVVNLEIAIKSIFPVAAGSYWYFSSYFSLFLFLPVLSKTADVLSRKNFKAMLLIMAVFFSAISLISGGNAFDLNRGYSAVWLGYLYLVGMYIKRYEPFASISKVKALIGYALCIFVTWGMLVYSDTLLSGTPLEAYSGVLLNYTSPTILGAGLFIFTIFKQINVRSSAVQRAIGLFAATSFSVYIIHSHPLVWEHMLKGRLASFISEPLPLIVLIVLGVTFGIYLFCSLIDLPRHFLFSALKLKKRLSGFENRIAEKLK